MALYIDLVLNELIIKIAEMNYYKNYIFMIKKDAITFSKSINKESKN